jgi:hypothetical protein
MSETKPRFIPSQEDELASKVQRHTRIIRNLVIALFVVGGLLVAFLVWFFIDRS